MGSLYKADFLCTFTIVSSNVTIRSTNSIITNAFLIRLVKKTDPYTLKNNTANPKNT